MKKILTLITVLLGLTFADMIKDHAYVISAIGIKNTTGEIAYISGSTNTPNADGSYNLVPQVIIYDGTTSYVGAATPFTGCIGNYYYFDSEKKGSCFMGGAMKGASASTKGESGLVPAPVAGQQSLFLRGDGTWAAPEGKNYSNATTSTSGLMSAADKTKLNGISESADSVSFSRSLSSGTKIGSININGTSTDMYAPTDTNTTYSAGTGISLSGTTFSNSGVRSVSTGSSNGTISVNTNGSTSNVAVKGLGSAAYTNSGAYASSSHTHDDRYYTESEIESKITTLNGSLNGLNAKLNYTWDPNNVGVWLDANLYRKVYYWYGVSLTSGSDVLLTSSFINANSIIKVEGYVLCNNTFLQAGKYMYFYVNGTNLYINQNFSSYFSNAVVCVTVYYI